MTISDWRLDYDAADPFPAASWSFGSWESGYFMTAMPIMDAADFTLDDTPVPRGDGIRFGQDFRGARNITFALATTTQDEPSVLDLIEDGGLVWRADAVRSTPGAMARLISHTSRVAFGRPRKWLPDDTKTFQGLSLIDAEFLTADDLWYDTQEISTQVGLIPASSGGFTSPLTAPIMSFASGNKSSGFTVGGSVPTWPVLTIHGPIVNPIVQVTNRFRFVFNYTLQADEAIVIDTRPWARTIIKNGYATIPTASTSSLLTEAALPPGSYELVLYGTATTGNPTATIATRDAYTHW